MRNQKAVVIGFLCAGFLSCFPVGAQPRAPAGPPAIPTQPETPPDVLGRSTPRGTVLGFLLAGRKGEDETASEFLNTRLTGAPAGYLAHQLFVVLNRKLPAGTALMELSDRPDGRSPFLTKPNENLIGTIASNRGNVDVIIERIDRGKDGQLWLFSSATLKGIPRLYEEMEAGGKSVSQILLETKFANIALFQWLAVFVGIPLLYLFIALLNHLLSWLTGFVRRRVRNRPDLANPQVLPMPVRLLIMALVIRVVLSSVDIPLLAREFWVTTTGVITIVAIVWVLILLNGVCEGFLLRRLKSLHRGETAASMLRVGRRLVDFILIFAGFLACLRYFGVNATAALTGLGVGGIAIALAAQKTLENLIGGISVVFDNAVRVGELVKVGDQSGVVEHIGLRSTRIRTLGRTIVSIPNGQLANVNVETISIRDKFWFHHTLNLRREIPASTLRDILHRVEGLLMMDSRVERESLRVRFLSLGTSSLDVEVFAYVMASDWGAFLKIQQDLLLEVMEIVEAAGAELAYPSQTLYLSRSGGLDDDLSLPEDAKDTSAKPS